MRPGQGRALAFRKSSETLSWHPRTASVHILELR